MNAHNAYSDLVVMGDAVTVLADLDPETAHLTFTSPPYYNAKEYASYKSYSEYLATLRSVFRQVYRVTREGRFLVVNTSPVITPREKRSCASVRHPIPFDLHAVLSELGWHFIDDIVWIKPEPAVKNRIASFAQHHKPLAWKPNAVTEYLFVYRKPTPRLIDWNMRQYPPDVIEDSKLESYPKTNVWEIAPASDPAHPAVFPDELARRIIALYSYKGDLVLDPFAGSGTVGKVASEIGREFLLIERSYDYVERIRQRVDNARVMSATSFMQYNEKKRGN